MTIEQLCCVSMGIVIQAFTFALGIVVGTSLRRREAAEWHDEESENHPHQRP
jgi:hypothetical protein